MLPSSQFDLAIIGGGPAGSSAAITAARLGVTVVLFEAHDFPRHKVCGEFVSAEALDVLRNLLQNVPGAQSIFDQAPVIDRTRLLLGGRVIEAAVSPAALSITRHDLDAHLWMAAQAAGVQALDNCNVTAIQGDGAFQMETSRGLFTAKALVIAAGRWSQFIADRTIPPGPKWIGLKAHFRESRASRSTDLYFFDNGYCGVQPIAGNMVNACAMVRSDRATSLPAVFDLHPQLAARTASWAPVMQTVSTAPLIYRDPQPVRGNVMLVGDAAAFIDPFVGDGISIALRSGRVAAQCIGRFLSGEVTLSESASLYRKEYSRQFQPLLLAASGVRSVFSLPKYARLMVFELMRFPGVIPFLIRRTRRAV